MQKLKMLKVNDDRVTAAVQADVHGQMQREKVENFYEYTANVIGRTTNNVRTRMKRGDWSLREIELLAIKTGGKNIRKMLRTI